MDPAAVSSTTTPFTRSSRRAAISGAAMDVFDEEPLPQDSRWRALDNVTITTHYGGDTEDTNRTSARLVSEAIAEFSQTSKIARAINAKGPWMGLTVDAEYLPGIDAGQTFTKAVLLPWTARKRRLPPLRSRPRLSAPVGRNATWTSHGSVQHRPFVYA